MAPERKKWIRKRSKTSDGEGECSNTLPKNANEAKRVRTCSQKCPINLFEDFSDTYSVRDDPYSDIDGEYGSDGNYEPENGDGISSDSSLDIFSKPKTARITQHCRVSESPCSVISDTSTEEPIPVSTVEHRATFEESRRSSEEYQRPLSGSLELPRTRSASVERRRPHSESVELSQTKSASEERRRPYGESVELPQTRSAFEERRRPHNQPHRRCVSEERRHPSISSGEPIGARLASIERRQSNSANQAHQELVLQQSTRRQARQPVRSSTPPPESGCWENSVSDIPNFNFDDTTTGPRVDINENTTVQEMFDIIFTSQILDYLVTCTNAYGNALVNQSRPHTRNCRMKAFRETNADEMKKFFALSLLQGHVKIPQRQKLFTHSDPLYYHPIFSYKMSGRRYEQILRCLYASQLNSVGSAKISEFINMLTENFRTVFYPTKELSLDESLMLFRGRLIFRTYMKNKKTKYGIKFYVLTTSDGYVLNIKMYTGTEDLEDDSGETGSKLQKLVLRLMRPYLLKGHELYMDNFYNSVPLTEKLLDLKTHTIGTLRSNRKGNPEAVTKKKIKKGEYCWLRKNKVYVSNWKDKRQVLMINTLKQPGMAEITNRRGQKYLKPVEVLHYNNNMAGIDRADQMISYYSSPRKSIRWYKKVLFHMLDIGVWNAFYLFKKYVKKDEKYEYVDYRDQLIKNLLQLQTGVIGKDLVQEGGLHWHKRTTQANPAEPQPSTSSQSHWPTRIPAKENSKKKYSFLNCRVCHKKKIRRETSYRCKGCHRSPPLCPECFEEWHLNTSD